MSRRYIAPKGSALSGKTELQRLGYKIIADTRINQQRGPRTTVPQRSSQIQARVAVPQQRSTPQRAATAISRPMGQRVGAAVGVSRQQPAMVQHQRTVATGQRQEQPAMVQHQRTVATGQRQEQPVISRGYVELVSQPQITRGFVEEIPLRKFPRKEETPKAPAPQPAPVEVSEQELPEESSKKSFATHLVFAPDSQLDDDSPKLIETLVN